MSTPRKSDLEFMKDPDSWPNWPVLPIKRRVQGQSWPDLALLSEAEVKGKVYIFPNANMFDQSTWVNPVLTTPEELIKEGWVVD